MIVESERRLDRARPAAGLRGRPGCGGAQLEPSSSWRRPSIRRAVSAACAVAARARAAAQRRLHRQQPRCARRDRGGSCVGSGGSGRRGARVLRRHRVRVAAAPVPHGDGAAGETFGTLGTQLLLERIAQGAPSRRRNVVLPAQFVVVSCGGRRRRPREGLPAGSRAADRNGSARSAPGPDDVRAAVTIPTTGAAETIDRAVEFFLREGPVDAAGIGSFGPIDAASIADLGIRRDDAEARLGEHRRRAGGSAAARRPRRVRHRRERGGAR